MTLVLVDLPKTQPLSYMANGQKYLPGGAVPPLAQCITVGQSTQRTKWRAAPRAAADFNALNLELVDLGTEPARITDCWRDQTTEQAGLRKRFDEWRAAGEPEPGDRAWRDTMSSTYAAKPGESNHGWGGAFDLQRLAFAFPGIDRGSNGALAMFWKIAAKHGFTPVIGSPKVSASESWHFDHLGSIADVHALAHAHNYSDPYGLGARVGCALVAQLPAANALIALGYQIQARLLLAGFWCGGLDGKLGQKSCTAAYNAGFLTDGIDAVTDALALADLLNRMETDGFADEAIAKL